MHFKRKTKVWLLGLWAGIVHGAASAGSAQFALATAAGAGIDVKPLDLRSLGAVLVAASISSALAYLRQSPVPREEDGTDFIVKQLELAKPGSVPPVKP